MTQPQVCIGLCNPKSPDNVGSVMRAAGNYGVDVIEYTGNRYPRALARNPVVPNLSRSVSKNISLRAVENFIDHRAENMQIVCVEFAENAIALPHFKHPKNACYIFGPEDGNISQEMINQADAVVYVPTTGCMNLAATVNVLLYDRMAKSFTAVDNNEIIRNNRDRNNNLKFPSS